MARTGNLFLSKLIISSSIHPSSHASHTLFIMFAKYSFFVLALATAALGGAVSNAEHASEAAACKPLNARM